MHANCVFIFLKLLQELQEIVDSILGVEIKKSKKSNHEGPNKISYLPDVIIGRILFFLPNKDAVLTSILSKRWMQLLTFITKLEFEDGDTFCRKIRIRKASFYRLVQTFIVSLFRLCFMDWKCMLIVFLFFKTFVATPRNHGFNWGSGN